MRRQVEIAIRRRAQFLVLTATAGEEDQASLIGFQASDIGSKGLDRSVHAAVIDSNTDCASKFTGDTSFLQVSKAD